MGVQEQCKVSSDAFFYCNFCQCLFGRARISPPERRGDAKKGTPHMASYILTEKRQKPFRENGVAIIEHAIPTLVPIHTTGHVRPEGFGVFDRLLVHFFVGLLRRGRRLDLGAEECTSGAHGHSMHTRSLEDHLAE